MKFWHPARFWSSCDGVAIDSALPLGGQRTSKRGRIALFRCLHTRVSKSSRHHRRELNQNPFETNACNRSHNRRNSKNSVHAQNESPNTRSGATVQSMAIIRSLEPGHSAIRLNRTEVDCTYQVFDDQNHGRVLHLATYGSDDRKSTPKVSQVIQLDEVHARKLIKILQNHFPAS